MAIRANLARLARGFQRELRPVEEAIIADYLIQNRKTIGSATSTVIRSGSFTPGGGAAMDIRWRRSIRSGSGGWTGLWHR